MSQPKKEETNQPSQPSQPSRSSGGKWTIAGLALVAILGLGFAGYTALNPHMSTVTQQQFMTNTQSFYNTQTQTATSFSTVTRVQVVTQTATTGYANEYYQNYCSYYGCGYGNGYYQSCSYYGCAYPPQYYNPPEYYNPAYSNYYYYQPPCEANSANSNAVSCQGFFYQAGNGCTVLVIPVSNPYIQESTVYQYYTLQNLTTTYPNWTWVTVNGQLYQGSNTSSSGVACPGNYITVSSISQ